MKDFKKYIQIRAEAEDVYACLTNPFTIELWSGYPATMEAIEGTDFEMWDGDISGKIVKLIPNKEVVQQWYFGEQEEASIVTYKIHKDNSDVSLELRHTNIPDEAYEEIVYGWNEYFLPGIKVFLEE